MKGKWLADLTAGVTNGSINLRDASNFIQARFAPKPVDLEFAGVRFGNADHILWSIVADIFISKVYTPKDFQIKKDNVVVDIGAHKGVFVAYAAQFSPKMILAIEPDKNNFTYLETLIENNSLANIELMNVAVADKSGNEVPLFMAESSSRNSLLGKDVVTGTQLIESQRVNTITLEDVLNKIGHVNYLKMDCEGAEFPIFQSANTRLFSDIYKIALEFHANESSPELRELISKMKSVYKFVSVTRTHPAMGYIYAKN